MEGSAVSADGIAVSYETVGAGAPALVFVHGWSCDRRYWMHQLDHFVDRYQVVAVDLAGHGASGMGREDWTMTAFGDDVVAIADQLRLDRMVLVGHSMGGDVIVAAEPALRGRVLGLVWVDTYRSLHDSPSSKDETSEFMAPFLDDFRAATDDLVRRSLLPRSNRDLVDWVATDMASASPEVALGALEHAITFEPTIVEMLRDMRTPIVALNPDFKPSDAASLGRYGVRLVAMPGLDHFPMMEDPPAFNRVLETAIRGFTTDPMAS